MEYEVSTTGGVTLITRQEEGLEVRVSELKKDESTAGLACCLGTLYRVKGGFVPQQIFLFVAGRMPLGDAGLVELKKVADFFFRTILGTELYVKEVPPDSALFGQEALRLYGKVEEEMHDGTVGAFCGSRAE
ncbi:hypothetical protein ACFFGT_04980 [Mucilaginibacter angelicae]|uniref:Uncharacterized protein n=1 Tax=Mucilaginibacter angelicae TaxID=869718 RepID=A0ABV6L1C9_9SPHI